MPKAKKIKVLMAKAGLDGHDRGVLIVSLALRDAGMEVIYTGRHQTPEAIADTAVQEDVNVVGISSLADAHRTLAPKVVNLSWGLIPRRLRRVKPNRGRDTPTLASGRVIELKKRGRGDIPVILGGFIQPEDIPELKKKGIKEVFSLDVKLDTIVNYIKENIGVAA